jgi:ABC-2 type transport system ATP-binding protein
MLEARHLVKHYAGVCAVNDVSFTVRPSDVLGYLGPNGSGKTTTANLLTGLIEPTRGQILFDGASIHDQLVEYRARLGYVPEEPHLYSYLSGREYLQLVGRLRGMREHVLDRKIDDFLGLFALATDADAPISSYSKGMRQKVLISAALMHNPDIVIFDEPTSGLDAASALVFRYLVQALSRAGKIVLYSSHELEAVEKVCSSVILLHEGRAVAHGSMDHLRELMHAESLEQVFAQLVFREDPQRIVDRMVDAMTTA